MPQSERSNVLKEIMKWLVTQKDGATVQALRSYIKWEITEGGATNSTIKKYVEDLKAGSLIEYKHPYWRVTNFGKTWLARHSL